LTKKKKAAKLCPLNRGFTVYGKSLNTSVLLFACINIVLYNAVVYNSILTHSRAIAQVVKQWFINTLLLAQYCVTSCGVYGGRTGTTAGFSHANHHSTIAPYSSITAPPEMCDIPDQAAQCHILDP
jgi:hypothetical protein